MTATSLTVGTFQDFSTLRVRMELTAIGVPSPQKKELLSPTLFSIANSLGAKGSFVAEIKSKVDNKKMSWDSALGKVLENWASWEGDKAYLDTLISVMRQHNLNGCADSLEKLKREKMKSNLEMETTDDEIREPQTEEEKAQEYDFFMKMSGQARQTGGGQESFSGAIPTGLSNPAGAANLGTFMMSSAATQMNFGLQFQAMGQEKTKKEIENALQNMWD